MFINNFFKLPKLYRVETSPLIKGRVTHNGTPLPGIKIERHINYTEKTTRYKTTRTNSQGEFTLTPYEMTTRAPGDMNRQQFIGLSVYAWVNHQPVTLWQSTLVDDIHYTPTVKRLLQNLIFDINNDDLYIELQQESESQPSIHICTNCELKNANYTVLIKNNLKVAQEKISNE